MTTQPNEAETQSNEDFVRALVAFIEELQATLAETRERLVLCEQVSQQPLTGLTRLN